MDDEFNWPTIIIFLFFFGWCIFEMHSCSLEHDSPEYKAKRAAEEKACATPVLVAEKDGVKLYAINYTDNCNGRVVYFSKSGTHTTHSERSGKTSHEVDDDTSSVSDDQ